MLQFSLKQRIISTKINYFQTFATHLHVGFARQPKSFPRILMPFPMANCATAWRPRSQMNRIHHIRHCDVAEMIHLLML